MALPVEGERVPLPYCTCRCHDTWFEAGEPIPARRALQRHPRVIPLAPSMTDKLEAGVACVHCQPQHLQALAL